MTILVTGATGVVGSAVARGLVDAGHAVIAAVRNEASCRISEGCPIATRRLDYDAPDTCAPALDGIDSVFLVAPPADPQAAERLAPFLAALAASKVTHVVVNSAVAAGYDDTFPLRRIERAVERANVNWTHLRTTWHMSALTTGTSPRRPPPY